MVTTLNWTRALQAYETLATRLALVDCLFFCKSTTVVDFEKGPMTHDELSRIHMMLEVVFLVVYDRICGQEWSTVQRHDVLQCDWIVLEIY